MTSATAPIPDWHAESLPGMREARRSWARAGSTPRDPFPVMRIQPTAVALHALGPRGLLLWVGDVLDASGIDASLQMSRLDLRADWQRIKLKAYERSHCVTYADRRSLHEVTEEMSGLTLGKRGGQIVARVSDKDREAHEKGHDWWPEMWGTNDDPDHKAIRIEFEFRRAGLVEFGVDTPEETLDRTT